jgi:ornithine lipid ester-linked acyl 2-hydroxylase
VFLDPSQFPFTALLEANWETVLRELERLPKGSFMAWPDRYLYGRPEQHEYGKGWDVFGLYAFGRKLPRNCALCPETTRLVETIPGMTTAGFSWLEPGTHIKPHVGYTSAVLRCHLGLVTPGDCGLRVGPEVKAWEPGKCMVFDDTTEHEAWNRSDTSRVVLIIDFTRPGETFTPPPQAVVAQVPNR